MGISVPALHNIMIIICVYIKSEAKRMFKNKTNNQNYLPVMLKLVPHGLSAPDIRVYTYIKP